MFHCHDNCQSIVFAVTIFTHECKAKTEDIYLNERNFYRLTQNFVEN